MLLRRLGSLDGAAVVIANVIGTGIFLAPAFIAQQVPSTLPFLGLWLVGGVLAVIGALSYAELAAMRPTAGGEYVYIREAFGALPGFLSGWTSLVAGFSGAIAAAAVGFAIYLDRLIPGAGSEQALLQVRVVAGLGMTVTPRVLVALGVIGLFTLIHVAGLGPGRVAMQALAWLNVATILALVVLGFLAERGDAGVAAPAPTAGSPPLEIGGALVALVLVMFTYSGWNAAAYIAGEFRDPGRSVPRALLGGTLVVTGLYLALNLLYVRVLGIGGLVMAQATGDRVVDVLWGDAGARLFTPVILLVLASSVSAMVLTGPRVYYAMARDRCLAAPFGRLAGRRVPAFSIVVQAAWSAVLVLTGGFEALLTYTGFAVVLFAGLGVAALFVLRARDPRAHRPFRVWGYPLTPALFVIASVAMLTLTILRAPGPALAGVALISLGAPVFLWVRKRAARRPAPLSC